MKLKNFVCALLAAWSLASCTVESDAIVNEVETSVSLGKNFNAKSVNHLRGNKNDPNLNNLVPSTTEKATAATACTSLNAPATFTSKLWER